MPFEMTGCLTIDSRGIIRAAEEESCALWGLSCEQMAGRFLLDLFVLEVQSQSDEDRQMHWEVLREAAESEPLPMEAKPAEGEPFPVEILLEPAENDFFHALLRLSASQSGSGASAPVDETPITGAPVPATPPPESPPPPAPVLSDREYTAGSKEMPAGPEGWQLLLDQPHLGFFDLDFLQRHFYYSPAWKGMLGYTDAELPNKHETFIKLIHPEDSEAAPDQSFHKRPGRTIPFSIEYRLRHKEGHYLWVQGIGSQVFDSHGDLARVTGIHLDIQERKEIEDETQRNEERFLALLHRGNLAFFDLDFHAGEAFFSPAWLLNLGYQEGELPALPKSFERLLDPSTFSEEIFSLFQDEKEDRQVFTREFRFQRKDGSFINLPLRIIRLSNRRGDLLRVIGLESQTLDSLPPDSRGPSPDMLTEGLRAAHEAVILTNAESRVVFANPKAEALIGCDYPDISGLNLAEALPLVQKSSGQTVDNLSDQVLASGSPISFSRDFRLRPANDEERDILLSCDPVRDANGRILGTVVVFRDPEEMSLTPEELVRSNRLDALGLLAGGIAHDFNNLLTAILGGVSLARETHEFEPLETSEKGCLAAKNLTRQLLGFARGRDVGRKAMRLNNLIRDCLRMATAGSKITANAELAEDLYPAEIHASKIAQVFQNLFVNAVQAMADVQKPSLRVTGKNVALNAGKVPDLDEGDYLMLVIEDSGPGIPRETLTKIFQPFFTTKKTGTGLGLSTVHTIIREHGGQITVTSRVGEGTAFTVYLPRTEETQEKEARRAPSLKYGSGRVLFMDDDEEIAALAAGMLQRLEYDFDIARNGEEAVSLYRRYLNVDRPYDAVILDLTIVGGMGGEETLQKLKELDPDVRAIVSSGYNSEETNEYYLNHGFYGILSKPYRSEEMGRILRQVLGKE